MHYSFKVNKEKISRSIINILFLFRKAKTKSCMDELVMYRLNTLPLRRVGYFCKESIKFSFDVNISLKG